MIIIAEVGINHNGDINLAHELIRQAKINGAGIAKFQFYDPDKIFGPKGSHPSKDNWEFAKKVTFNFEQAGQLKAWCDEEEIEFMAAAFDEERFEWMESLGVKRHKIASRMVEQTKLCQRILDTGKETFISLGFWNGDGAPYAAANARYLYCVAKYPCQHADISLPVWFADSIYDGFSDHTIGIEMAMIAAARGASVIEKHFTLNKGLPGPDHICSMTPSELAVLSAQTRQIQKALRAMA